MMALAPRDIAGALAFAALGLPILNLIDRVFAGLTAAQAGLLP